MSAETSGLSFVPDWIKQPSKNHNSASDESPGVIASGNKYDILAKHDQMMNNERNNNSNSNNGNVSEGEKDKKASNNNSNNLNGSNNNNSSSGAASSRQFQTQNSHMYPQGDENNVIPKFKPYMARDRYGKEDMLQLYRSILDEFDELDGLDDIEELVDNSDGDHKPWLTAGKPHGPTNMEQLSEQEAKAFQYGMNSALSIRQLNEKDSTMKNTYIVGGPQYIPTYGGGNLRAEKKDWQSKDPRDKFGKQKSERGGSSSHAGRLDSSEWHTTDSRRDRNERGLRDPRDRDNVRGSRPGAPGDRLDEEGLSTSINSKLNRDRGGAGAGRDRDRELGEDDDDDEVMTSSIGANFFKRQRSKPFKSDCDDWRRGPRDRGGDPRDDRRDNDRRNSNLRDSDVREERENRRGGGNAAGGKNARNDRDRDFDRDDDAAIRPAWRDRNKFRNDNDNRDSDKESRRDRDDGRRGNRDRLNDRDASNRDSKKKNDNNKKDEKTNDIDANLDVEAKKPERVHIGNNAPTKKAKDSENNSAEKLSSENQNNNNNIKQSKKGGGLKISVKQKSADEDLEDNKMNTPKSADVNPDSPGKWNRRGYREPAWLNDDEDQDFDFKGLPSEMESLKLKDGFAKKGEKVNYFDQLDTPSLGLGVRGSC